jgi:hypothetical protein
MRPHPLAVAAILLALLASCATQRPARVSPDGREVRVHGERWQAQDGITLFERDGALHVVSVGPEATFDVAVPLGPDGRPAWQPDAPFEVSAGVIRLRTRGGSRVAALVDSRQLHPHNEHFHLTSRYVNADWQALYALREEGSPLDPARQQLAASVLAELLDERIPGSSEEATLGSLRRIDSVLGKVRRAVQAGQPGRQVLGILSHDFEISEDGRALEIEGQRFRAGDGVRFTYDGGHFHVQSTSGDWVQVIQLEAMDPGSFELPPSFFYELRDGVVEARPPSSRWQALAAAHQIRFVRDHWHLTEAYPPLHTLMAATEDPSLPEPLRELARGRALEVLRIRLDAVSELELESRLTAVDGLIARLTIETERERRGAKR